MVRSAQPQARPAIASAARVAAAPQSAPASARELAPNEFAVRAPMIGTFYWAPAPGEKPFIEVGQRVKANDTVGVIEVMKLFNTISAEVDGTVVRIEAQNATLVEFGQPLVIIAKE
jgi:acetyl-CoA carboxylase biotin carboxyl carrier protein